METRSGIVGAGPAGLLLSHILERRGIRSVVLEDRDRAYVEQQVRGRRPLEQGTVGLLNEIRLGERMTQEVSSTPASTSASACATTGSR